MTLILNVLTPDYAVQVSDRRLTYTGTGDHTDVTPKTTIFHRAILFGYTGMGLLGNPPEATHRAITAKLTQSLARGGSGEDRLRWLATQFKAGVGAVPIPPSLQSHAAAIRRLAIAGVGFASRGADQPLRPVYMMLSNFWTKEGGWLAEARDEFAIVVESLPSTASYWLRSAGAELTRDERRFLERALNKAVNRGRGAQAIARLLVEQVRAVAERNTTVGKSLLVSSIARSAVPVDVSIKLTAPDFTQPTFLYIPEDSDDGVLYGPNVADPGMSFCDVWVSDHDINER